MTDAPQQIWSFMVDDDCKQQDDLMMQVSLQTMQECLRALAEQDKNNELLV